MGLNISVKKKHTMEAGVHLVSIADIKYARDFHRELKTNKNGDNGLDIRFKNKEGHIIENVFWLGDKSMWVLESLCKVIGVDLNAGLDVKHIMGKKLTIVVADEYLMDGNKRKLDSTGSEIRYSKLVPMFFSKDENPTIDKKVFTIERQG